MFRGLRYRPENTCYLRDAWVKDSFRAMGWSASRSQYVHLYINGLYWGLYEPSEHLDASYFSLRYGGPEGAWDVLVGEDNNGPPVVVDGSVSDWQTLTNLAGVSAGIRRSHSKTPFQRRGAHARQQRRAIAGAGRNHSRRACRRIGALG